MGGSYIFIRVQFPHSCMPKSQGKNPPFKLLDAAHERKGYLKASSSYTTTSGPLLHILQLILVQRQPPSSFKSDLRYCIVLSKIIAPRLRRANDTRTSSMLFAPHLFFCQIFFAAAQHFVNTRITKPLYR